MTIDLDNAVASIKHLNIRKEGPEDDKVLAVDMKLEIIAAAADILPYFDPALRHFLFNDETNQVRFRSMGAINWTGEMLNMEMEIYGLEFRNVRISKFVIEPKMEKRRAVRPSDPFRHLPARRTRCCHPGRESSGNRPDHHSAHEPAAFFDERAAA
ncbi:MAG: hypothetical protein ACYC0Z_12970 [Acidobacteriaceae bacterium]